MVIIVVCLSMEKKSSSLKSIMKIFPTQFCLRSMSNGFGAIESRAVSLKGSVYDFSVDVKHSQLFSF